MEQPQEKLQNTDPSVLKENAIELEGTKEDMNDSKSSGPDSKTQDTVEGESSDLASPEWREAINNFEEVKVEGEAEIPPPDKDTAEALKALLEYTKRGDHIRDAIDPNVKRTPLPSNLKELKVPDGNNGSDFLCGNLWRRDSAEGLEMIDKGIIERQRQILKWLLKSAGRLILEGKSLVNMSLPIIISSKETSLHRAAGQCGYAPELLTKAGQQQMVTEAFKQVVTYCFVTHHLGINQEKPFNPILGETYEGYLGGIPVYGEQISHHPPISTILMKTEDFVLQNHFNLEIVLAGPNSVKATQLGRYVIRLPKLGMEVWGLPSAANISGAAIGKRVFNWADKLRVFDPKNNLYAEIQFNSDDKGFVGNLFSSKKKEADKVAGKIYQLKEHAMKDLYSKNPTGVTKWTLEPEKHVAREICAIEGKWTKYLNIGGRSYWNVEETRPYQLVDALNKTLPSDSNFREDLIYRKLGNFEAGQVTKEKMEDAQRADKRLRQGKKEKEKGKH